MQSTFVEFQTFAGNPNQSRNFGFFCFRLVKQHRRFYRFFCYCNLHPFGDALNSCRNLHKRRKCNILSAGGLYLRTPSVGFLPASAMVLPFALRRFPTPICVLHGFAARSSLVQVVWVLPVYYVRYHLLLLFLTFGVVTGVMPNSPQVCLYQNVIASQFHERE